MDKKLKARWVKALESGKYKQGTNRLAGGGYYCCLGVLRKIEPSISDDGGGLLEATCGIHPRQQRVLAIMNDDKRKNFKEIAQWIKSHL
jgi:hypothetical protein